MATYKFDSRLMPNVPGFMEAAGLTKVQFAQAGAIPLSTLHRIGQCEPVTRTTAEKIIHALNVLYYQNPPSVPLEVDSEFQVIDPDEPWPNK